MLTKQKFQAFIWVFSLQTCDGPLLLLQVHYHGEPISVNVSINNCTSKVIKKIKISGELLFPCPAPSPQTTSCLSKTLSHLPVCIHLSFPSNIGLSKYISFPMNTFTELCIVWSCIRFHLKTESWGLEDNWLNSYMLFLVYSVDQITDVVLYSLDKYTKTVFIQEFTWAGTEAGVTAKRWDGGKWTKRQRRGLGKEEEGVPRNKEGQDESWSIEGLSGEVEGGDMTYPQEDHHNTKRGCELKDFPPKLILPSLYS